jgi:carboxyl-terminal processing protease
MLANIADHRKKDLIENKPEITEMLQQEIVSRYYYQKGRIESTLSNDTELKNAVDVLLSTSKYASILDGTFIKADSRAKPIKSQN